MLEKYNRYGVLKVFFNNPTEKFGLREISRLAKISPPSVMAYLKEFEKETLIDRIEKKVPLYKAMRENENFIFYKKISILYELHSCGLIEELWNKLAPQAIILYGSSAKGEAIENSDIDIFVIGKEKKVDIERFEDKLGKKVHLMFETELGKVPKELRNNLINGVVLKGYLRAF